MGTASRDFLIGGRVLFEITKAGKRQYEESSM